MPPAAVPISPVGPVAAATMVFRENGQVRVAAIVKATFAFVHHGPMRLVAPEAIFTKEAHRMNNPTRSIVAASDLVPRLPGADVLLLGHAHAPGGSAARVTVRLAVGRGDVALLDKRAHVLGDRKGGEIVPFKSIPLVYEKAYGGPGYRDNPIGTGVLEGDAPPNVVDPITPDRVAGFGPISRSWPSRSQFASSEVRAGLDRAIAEVPPGLDLRYFHAAPVDQRIGQIVGDEWILLEGVHAELPRIHLQLPGAMAMVRVIGTEADGRIFSLRADTLRIDSDASSCTVVWRNSFPVREVDLATVRLLAGVALPDVPIAWPLHVDAGPRSEVDARAPTLSNMPAVQALRAAATGHGGTMVLEDATLKLGGTFSGTMEIADEDLEPASEMAPDFGSTAILSATMAPVTQPLPRGPFAAAGPARSHGEPLSGTTEEELVLEPTRPLPKMAAPARKEMTLDLSEGFSEVGRAILPFAGKGPGEAVSSGDRVSSAIPGAPWDPGRDSRPPSEARSRPVAEGTLDLSGTMSSRAAPPARESAPETPWGPSQRVPSTVPVQEVGPPQVARPPQMERPPEVVRLPDEVSLPEEVSLPQVERPSHVVSLPEEVSLSQVERPPPAVVHAEPPADPWGQSLRDVPPELPPPAARAEAPKPVEQGPSLKNALYKRFKK